MYGIAHTDTHSEGGLLIDGGTVEGNFKTAGVYITGTTGAVRLNRVHLECSGTDVLVDTANNVEIDGGSGARYVLNRAGLCTIRNCYVNRIDIDPNCFGTKIENTKYAGSGTQRIYDLGENTTMVNLSMAAGTSYARGYKSPAIKDLAANGDLERWSSVSTLDVFHSFGNAVIERCGAGMNDTTVYQGTYCAKVTGAATHWTGLGYSLPSRLALQRQWITIDCWMKVVRGSGSIGMYWNGGSIAVAGDADFGSGTWEHHVLSFWHDATYTDGVVVLKASDKSIVYFDSVRVLANTVPSGSFEQLLGSGSVHLRQGRVKTSVVTLPNAAIITKVVIRCPSGSMAGGTNFLIGSGINADTWKEDVDLSGLAAKTSYMVITRPENTVYTLERPGAAFGIRPVQGAIGDVTAVMDVFGYLY